MNEYKRELYCMLTKQIALDEHQFSGITVCNFTDSGWKNDRFVFEECFKQVICRASKIYLKGYKSNWDEDLEDKNKPFWSQLLKENISKEGYHFILNMDDELANELYDFWLEPGVLLPRSGGRFLRPAKVVFKIDPNQLPIAGIFKVVSCFGNVSNPWAGGFESVGAWVRNQIENDDSLYVVFKGFSNLTIFGGPNNLTEIIDLVLNEGLRDNIEEHTPGFWDDEFLIKENEPLSDAVSRLIQET